MSDTVKPKRAQSKSGRPRSRPPARDPRAEQRVIPRDGDMRSRRSISRPGTELLPTRIAVLEAELARLKEERGAEADELARMLVRIAEAERARSVAEAQLRRGAEAAEMAARRAGLAENSAADGAAALDRTRAEREADRTRVTDLEARVARMRREHTAELAALRTAEADAGMRAAREVQEERSAAAHARQQAERTQRELAAARDTIARVTALVDEMDRREEMTSALRARSLLQARRVLCGQANAEAPGEPSGHPATPDAEMPAPTTKSCRPSPEDTDVGFMTIDELDFDLADS